jgi:hypothetical protein
MVSMAGPLRRVDNYFFVDDDDIYFSITTFLRDNPKIRDIPESRAFIADEMKRTFPGILILEEYN